MIAKWRTLMIKQHHFIGLGSGGSSALMYFYSRGVKGSFTAITEPGRPDLPAKIRLIPFISPKLPPLGRKHLYYPPDMKHPLFMPEGISTIFNGDERYVLLAGLGHYTGTKLAEALSLQLHQDKRDFVTLCSVPFSWEGRAYNTYARNAITTLQAIPGFNFFELDSLREMYDDLLLSEAFDKADELFYSVFENILAKDR